MRSAALLAGVFGLALAATAAVAEPHTHVIEIGKMAFGPAPKDVHVGDTVTWRNRDMFRHSATAKAGGFDVDLPAGGQDSTVVKTAGSIAYFCRFHPNMTGTVEVLP